MNIVVEEIVWGNVDYGKFILEYYPIKMKLGLID